MRKSSFILGAILFASPIHANLFAQGSTLDLATALQEAENLNPRYLAARAAAKEARWARLEALSANLPHATLSSTHFFDEKYQYLDLTLGGSPVSIAQVYPQTTFSLGAQWTVFDGLETPYRFQSARLKAQAAELEEERAALEKDSAVKIKFYQALAAQTLKNVADQNVKTLQDHYAKAKARQRAGETTRFELLRIQVQLEEAVPEQQRAEDNVVIARQELYQTMGLPEDQRTLTGDLPEPTATLPEGIEMQPQKRADVEAAMLRAQAAHDMSFSRWGAWLPKFSFMAEKVFYNNYDSSITNSDRFRDAYSVGVQMSWNILDAANLARQMEATYQSEESKQISRAAALKAPQELELWSRRYRYGVALYSAKKRAVEAAEESTRLAQVGFSAGTRTNTEVLDAELDLFRARAGAVRAQVDAAEAWCQLELALGRTLPYGSK